MKQTTIAMFAAAAIAFAGATQTTYAQMDGVEADAAAAVDEPAAGAVVASANAKPQGRQKSEFEQVLLGSGPVGFILWLALFGSGGFYIYLVVTLGILIRPVKIMPQVLVDNVTAAMKEGDVVKALQFCENEPTPMASILSAGFSHVEEGFEVIQEAISTAADIENERLNQRLTWLSVDANIAPMLGLLGTVQGMIMAFASLATGSPDVAELAKAISQALWTTAAGLVVAIPAVCTYYAFRNKCARIVLRMEATTMELVKDLRHVEVVAE